MAPLLFAGDASRGPASDADNRLRDGAVTTQRLGACAAIISGALLLLPAAALGQGVTTPTSVPGVRIVTAPPPDFDPVTASPELRARYAIPPAPDAAAAPNAFNEWRKAVTGPRRGAGAPNVQQTEISHGPIKKIGPSVPSVSGPHGATNGIKYANSSNWSGISFVGSGAPFAVEAIQAEFVVPTARQAFNSCTGGWDYAALWPGIDGNGSPDVLQAGVEVDAYCSGGATESFYSAWIEWFPYNSVRVSEPTIHHGDVVFIQVWNVSPTQGYAYFYNFSTQTAAGYALTAPSGYAITGNSIEWIAERPGVGAGLATLTNYIDSSSPYSVAWNYASRTPTYYYPGSPADASSLELITMLDNNGQPISMGVPVNNFFLYFTNSGSSFGTEDVPYQ